MQFSDAVKHWMDHLCNSHAIDCHDMCSMDESLRDAFDHAAHSVLSTKPYSTHKPWISSLSLSLIARRDAARASGDHTEEMALSKQIKRRVRVDKAKCLDELVAEGDWSAIKLARGKSKRQLVTLGDDHSNIVSTEHRAETLAAYFERVKWALRPTTLFQNDLIRRSHTIDVNCSQVTFLELRKAVDQLKSNTQCGADGVPSEF